MNIRDLQAQPVLESPPGPLQTAASRPFVFLHTLAQTFWILEFPDPLDGSVLSKLDNWHRRLFQVDARVE